MCDGDLIPVTVRPVVGNNESGTLLLFLGETERLHTCRNFSTIREWVNKRGRWAPLEREKCLSLARITYQRFSTATICPLDS